MSLLAAVRACVVVLVVLTLGSCAEPGSPSSVGGPGSAVPSTPPASASTSRISVVNESETDLTNLHLLFPQDDVAVGDVAAGETTDHVEVPGGVYNYSAFSYEKDGEQVIQPVIDFVGESPLPVDDYSYVLGVEPGSQLRINLLSLLRAHPTIEEAVESGVSWVQVRNDGPDDLAGFTLLYPQDEQLVFGAVPAGTTSLYTRLYDAGVLGAAAVVYTEDGTRVAQPAPDSGWTQPSASPGGPTAGVFAYVVGYDRDEPTGAHVEQRRVETTPPVPR